MHRGNPHAEAGIKKVKGHTTDLDIANGGTSLELFRGNGFADYFAGLGAANVQELPVDVELLTRSDQRTWLIQHRVVAASMAWDKRQQRQQS